MTALEEIKKALEGVTPGPWFEGDKWVFVSPRSGLMDEALENVLRNDEAQANARYIAAVNPAAISDLLSTLESLQRENEALKRDRYDLAYAITGGEDAPGLLDSVPTSHLVEMARATHRSHSADIDRAMAAEAEVKRLQAEIDRTARNRDMWKGQVERQAAQIEDFRSETKRLQVGVYVETLPAVHLIRVFADDMNERNWDDKRAYIKQQADRIRTALASTGGEHHADK